MELFVFVIFVIHPCILSLLPRSSIRTATLLGLLSEGFSG